MQNIVISVRVTRTFAYKRSVVQLTPPLSEKRKTDRVILTELRLITMSFLSPQSSCCHLHLDLVNPLLLGLILIAASRDLPSAVNPLISSPNTLCNSGVPLPLELAVHRKRKYQDEKMQSILLNSLNLVGWGGRTLQHLLMELKLLTR